MYGYIRPNRGELRVKEYERFRACYCGLCRTLGRRYGPVARFAVNYDLTFLAMLLSDEPGKSCLRFCPAHPLRRRRCVQESLALDRAADVSVILAWWKLEDERQDGTPVRRLVASLGRLLLRRSYRKSRLYVPELDDCVQAALSQLRQLEEERCASLDKTADCFARILRACATCVPPGPRREVLEELLYHVGRSIYLLDAADDRGEDAKKGRYNPLMCRFAPGEEETAAQTLQGTLNLSQRQCMAAFALLEETEYSPIVENILSIGLPQVTQLVLSGQWKDRKKRARVYARGTGES